MKKNNSHIQMPPMLCNSNRVRSLVDNDLNFLSSKGYITQKYLSKTPRINYIKVPRDIKTRNTPSQNAIPASYCLYEELKDSMKLYEDYQKLIKPEKNYMNDLSPYSQRKAPKGPAAQEGVSSPKASYIHYKMNSMNALTIADTRIKKAKEYIQIAKNLSKKYC